MKDYVKALLITHILTYVTIGFDIPILRQAVCFFYLTFVPGFVILKVLKLESKRIDVILFSVGLSIAFLMFTGLVMCELYSIFGVSKPLSTIPLIIAMSSITLSLLLVGCRQDLVISADSNLTSRLKTETISLRAVFLVFLPLLSIIGALWGNTLILLIMIIGIAMLYGLSVSSRIVPSKLYFLIIFVISIALLFHTSLISKYLMGWDIHLENYVFRSTEIKGYWSPPGVGVYSDTARFESVLSITILPTVYSLLLDISGEVIFKVIYPLIFCLVPLVLYRIYEVQTSKIVALLSVLFFMSNSYGFFGVEPLSLGRQMIAELFLVLSIFLIVEKKIPMQKRRALFLIFGAALVVSHYALSYFYIFLIVFTFILLRKWRSRELLSAVSVLLLFTMIFSWYLYVSDAPLMKLTNDFRRVYYNFFADVFNPDARAPQLSTLTSSPTGIISLIHRIVFYVQNFFIVIGVAELIVKGKKTEFDSKYRLMSIMSMFVLVLCLAIPYLAVSFQLTRFYAITIIFLAPFFILGGETVFNWVKKTAIPFIHKFSHKLGSSSHRGLTLKLVSVVLIASFLFDVGLIDHIAGTYPESYSLDADRRRISKDLNIRMGFYVVYALEQDVLSAVWLSEYMNETCWVYADRDSRLHVLLSYGLIPLEQSYPLFHFLVAEHVGYVYLRRLNVVNGLIVTPGMVCNISEISSSLDTGNKIYSNGASEIYWPPS